MSLVAISPLAANSAAEAVFPLDDSVQADDAEGHHDSHAHDVVTLDASWTRDLAALVNASVSPRTRDLTITFEAYAVARYRIHWGRALAAIAARSGRLVRLTLDCSEERPEALARHYDRTPPGRIRNDDLIAVLRANARTLEHLCLRYVDSTPALLSDRTLEFVGSHCLRLTSLSLDNFEGCFTRAGVAALLGQVGPRGRLVSLELTKTYDWQSPAFVYDGQSPAFAHDDHVGTDNVVMEAIRTSCPNLVHLCFGGEGSMVDQGLLMASVADDCPWLASAIVVGSEPASSPVVLVTCRQLTTVDVLPCARMDRWLEAYVSDRRREFDSVVLHYGGRGGNRGGGGDAAVVASSDFIERVLHTTRSLAIHLHVWNQPGAEPVPYDALLVRIVRVAEAASLRVRVSSTSRTAVLEARIVTLDELGVAAPELVARSILNAYDVQSSHVVVTFINVAGGGDE